MATQRPRFAVSYPELAAALLSSSEVTPRAHLIAQQLSSFFGECAVVVYLYQEDAGWEPKATEGEVAFSEPVIAPDFGTLGAILAKQAPVVFTGPDLRREDYAHLNVRRTLASLAGIPLFMDDNLVGAVEILSFQQPIAESSLSDLAEFSKLAALGLAAGAVYENERNSQLESITRITQMYDLEKVFNSNLEMDELMPMIASKFQEIMNVQAVNLWMVDGDGVVLTAQAGVDPTTEIGTTQNPGQGVAGDISDSGEPVLIEDPEDPRLTSRNEGVEEGAIFTLVAAPIMSQGSLVGVAEAINRNDGTPFDEDEQFLLTTMCETASNALHNASLLQAERKVEILETLVTVSKEITSTLNLDTVMDAIVNEPKAVIPYERAAIALERQERLHVRAVSGMKEILPGDPEVERLRDILQWAALSGEDVFITQCDDKVEADREETRAKFERYFADSGMRGFFATPLTDEQGRVGMLSFESSDPDFLTPVHIEMIKVLSGQATVSLRNAQMYKEVPFIGLLEPVLAKKRRFMALEKSRRRVRIIAAIAVAAFLVAVPFPFRVDGMATVAPARTLQVQSQVEGVVADVKVREGDRVAKGDILADLEDWNYRAELAAAQAKYAAAVAGTNRALAANNGGEGGIQRVQADFWAAEVARARERLERTHLRSPIDGIVATPHVDELVGHHLQPGDTFAQVVDTRRAIVDVAVDDRDVPLLRSGESASVKLDGLPTRTLHGEVVVVSPLGEGQADERVFYARVSVPNDDGVLRAGMQGKAKVMAGWRPAGFVLFRGTARWFWAKLWWWMGW